MRQVEPSGIDTAGPRVFEFGEERVGHGLIIGIGIDVEACLVTHSRAVESAVEPHSCRDGYCDACCGECDEIS